MNRKTPVTSFSLTARLRSFQNALRGVWFLLSTQHNAWVHAVSTVAVIAFSIVLRISRPEWCLIIGAIGFVWVAEAFNTALEALCDASVPEQHPLIGVAKDVAAGAVFISAGTAAAIGVIVLGPPLLAWIR